MPASIEIADGKAVVERAFEDGYEKLAVALPCALTVLKEANVPRMASLRGKMAAKKLNIAPMTAEKRRAPIPPSWGCRPRRRAW
jgi:electron transfer flavoprotein beta subunit